MEKKIPENKGDKYWEKGNQDKLDKWDYAISISSGAKQHHLRDFTHHPNIVG